VAETQAFDDEIRALEAGLRKLEAEYNMFFAGQLPRPPWETRSHVASLVRQVDRTALPSYADRFRFLTLQARFAAFTDLWDRGLRAREEGRPGPFSHLRTNAPEPAKTAEYRILHVVVFADPVRELDKLRELYERLADARRELGEQAIPFHRFAGLVRDQVKTLRSSGVPEVAFRLAIQDGHLAFTARALKGFTQE
jgi:hypothetical protein